MHNCYEKEEYEEEGEEKELLYNTHARIYIKWFEQKKKRVEFFVSFLTLLSVFLTLVPECVQRRKRPYERACATTVCKRDNQVMKKRVGRKSRKNVFRIHRSILMMEVIKLFPSCSSLSYYQLRLVEGY